MGCKVVQLVLVGVWLVIEGTCDTPTQFESNIVDRTGFGTLMHKVATINPSDKTFLSGFLLTRPPIPDFDHVNLMLDCEAYKQEHDYNMKKELCEIFKSGVDNLNTVITHRAQELQSILGDIELILPGFILPSRDTDSGITKRNILGDIISDLVV